MKKLLLITSMLIILAGCNKEADENTTDACYDCVIHQKFFVNNIVTNEAETIAPFCGSKSDMETYQSANTHTDSGLEQTCKCTKK